MNTAMPQPDALAHAYADAWRGVQALQRRWQARLIETHISWVLLDGQHAWKFKKPVRLPFLDFTALATRQRLCEEELRLNRRLAPSLYLDVLPITGSPDAPAVGGEGDPIDWVLRMKQFPPGALMCERLRAGTLSPAHIDSLATRLTAFHRAAPSASQQLAAITTPADPQVEVRAPWGSPARIAQGMRALIDGLARQGCGHPIEADLTDLRHWSERQGAALQGIWLQRQREGHVIEGHGDLHLANLIVLDDGEVTAFDCIEFDPALRWIDTMNDIAFVVMDLMAHGRHDLAWRFLNRYLDDSGDHAGLPTLRYYMVERALVRAMVAALPGAQHSGMDAGSGERSRPDYLGLAMRLTAPARPRLLITHGLSGSGKSWQTQHLLEQAGAIRLRSDVLRRLLPTGAGAESRYSEQATRATYDRLHTLASMAISAGYPVIVDATFLKRAERQRFAALAKALSVPFHILHCQAPVALLQQRIRERCALGNDASEADVAVLARQMQAIDPLDVAEQACTLAVQAAHEPASGQAIAQAIDQVLTQWRGTTGQAIT